MRKVSIRELKSKLSANLKDLPFQVWDAKTKTVIANVSLISPSDDKDRQIQLLQAKILELESSPPPYRSRDREIETVAPPVEGRCVIPFCRGYGPYRTDFEVWDETFGEMKKVLGFICPTHYKKR